MSSFELLELCEYMPETGAFKPALARYNPIHEWLTEPPPALAAVYQTANELAVLRASQVPQASSEELGSILFITPSQLRKRIEEREELLEARDDIYAWADRTPQADEE